MSLTGLEHIVKEQPDNTEARYSLALSYIQSNRYTDGTHELLKVLDKEPVRADVLNDLGVCYLFQQRYYEALVALEAALTAKPNYAPAYANLGRLHLITKMPFTAMREMEKAVQLDGTNVTALCDLGEASQQTLNLKNAVSAYQRAIKRDNHYVLAYVGLGRSLYSLGRYDEAEKVLNQALALSPNHPTALSTLGKLHLDKATNAESLAATHKLFERVSQLDPLNPDVWYDLGRVYLREGKPTEAITTLSRSLNLSPQDTGALHELERALRAAGRTTEADRVGQEFQKLALREREETHLEEHIAHDPQDWDARVRLALSYLETGNRGMALLLCRQVQHSAPQTPQLAILQQRLNEPHSASAPNRSSGNRN